MLPPASEIKRMLTGGSPFLIIFISRFSQYHLAIAAGSSTLIATCSRRIRFLRPAKAELSSFVVADSVPQPVNVNAAKTRTIISNLFTIALHTILQLLSAPDPWVELAACTPVLSCESKNGGYAGTGIQFFSFRQVQALHSFAPPVSPKDSLRRSGLRLSAGINGEGGIRTRPSSLMLRNNGFDRKPFFCKKLCLR